jgi:hypothetical protein
MRKRFDKNAEFEKIRKYTYKCAAAAARTSILTFDEAVSAAMLGVAQAFKTYDRSTKMITWASCKIDARILDEIANKYLERKRASRCVPIELFDVPEKEHPVWDDDQDWITDDVHTVLLQFINPKGKVLKAIVDDKRAEYIRNEVRASLRKLKWSEARIRKAFVTIKNNLGAQCAELSSVK